MIDRLMDIFLVRYTKQGEDNNFNRTPHITTGSIVFGALIRLFVLTLVSWGLIQNFEMYDQWIIFFTVVMFVSFYPAYRQWEHFHARVTAMEETTLCGSCKHFDSSGQLCRPLDEHVSADHIPCEGQSWEPKFVDVQEIH